MKQRALVLVDLDLREFGEITGPREALAFQRAALLRLGDHPVEDDAHGALRCARILHAGERPGQEHLDEPLVFEVAHGVEVVAVPVGAVEVLVGDGRVLQGPGERDGHVVGDLRVRIEVDVDVDPIAVVIRVARRLLLLPRRAGGLHAVKTDENALRRAEQANLGRVARAAERVWLGDAKIGEYLGAIPFRFVEPPVDLDLGRSVPGRKPESHRPRPRGDAPAHGAKNANARASMLSRGRASDGVCGCSKAACAPTPPCARSESKHLSSRTSSRCMSG